MNCQINSESFLNLPLYENSSYLAVYFTLVLLSDPSGEVQVSRSELATRLNFPVVVVDIAITHLQQCKLLECDNNIIRLYSNKAWDLQQDSSRRKSVIPKIQKSKTFSTVPVASAKGIDERIEDFVTLAREQHAVWLEKHPDKDFPTSELEAFIRYWTEHNDGGRTFRREQQKTWQFQSRLTTWQEKYERSGKDRKTEVSIKDYNEKLYLQERERAEQKRREEWASRPKDGLAQYKEELRRAVEGDEELRRKYPHWEESAKRML